MLPGFYEEASKNDEQSKISLQTIDYITELVTNYAKYGSVSIGNDAYAF